MSVNVETNKKIDAAADVSERVTDKVIDKSMGQGRLLKGNMRNIQLILPVLFLSSLALHAQTPDSGPIKPDNTAVNKRDTNPGEATADQQKMNAADRDMTAKIRKWVMADKSLSTYAHNVKIISQDGTVTLKGPVRSDLEVKSLVAKATAVTGTGDKVVNQLSVQPISR
jgi:hyperosmotically inducible protein